MKRDIEFVGKGCMGEALGVTQERGNYIEKIVEKMIENGGTLRSIVTHFNENEDLNDAEWTAFIFSLGYFDGARGADFASPERAYHSRERRFAAKGRR